MRDGAKQWKKGAPYYLFNEAHDFDDRFARFEPKRQQKAEMLMINDHHQIIV